MKQTAVFYKAGDALNSYEAHVPAPYLRLERSFPAGRRYTLTVSGLGFYMLWVNGKEITKGLLAPYISNPDDLVYFDRYDITALVAGQPVSAIGIVLGNGMQNAPGGAVWDFDIARFRNAPCFAALLTVTDADGNEETTDLGAGFRAHPSPILFDDLRSGCFYDANLALPGWNEPGFDDADWTPVKKADAPRGEYRICTADPITVREEIAPVSVRPARMDDRFSNRENMRLPTQYRFNKLGQEGVLFDFGVNTAGVCRLRVDGEPGQQIYIQFCELMTQDGRPSYLNSGSFYPDGYGQSLLYICKGEPDETFVPAFCYYGFRYAMVFGLTPAQVRPETLTLLAAGTDLRDRGGFCCSDATMNALGRMARNSDRSNFFYFPTDCPHREKNGWTGDAAVSAEHMLLTLTPDASYREWLRNICRAQAPDGSLPGIVPTGGWGFEWGNGPAWDNVLSELCWQLYRMRGDLAAAGECADALLRYLAYLSVRRDADGLIDFGLGDWLQPGKGAGDSIAPVRLTSSVMSLYIAEKSARLFDALGYATHAKFAWTLQAELRKAVRDEFIDFSSMTVHPRCQTSQAMCLYYGVFDPAERPQACRVLETIVHESGDHIDCGMLGLRVIFHVLSDCGLGDLAFRMITRTDFPSYGMFVARGMTSLPEDFQPDEDLDTPNSLNHHFFGDFVSWMIQRVVGIRVNPALKGPDDFEIAPDFLAALDFAEGFYEAPCGKVTVRWERRDAAMLLRIEAPAAATGRITLPAGWVFADDPWGRVDGADRLPLAAGEYRCRRRTDNN